MFGKSTALNGRLCDLDRLVEQRFVDLDRLLDQRFAGQEKAIRVAEKAIEDQTLSHLKSHEREHHDQSTALDKMEKRFDQRLAEANQFRQQIEGERGDYVRRDMLDQQIRGIETALARIEQARIVPIETWRIDLTSRLAWYAVIVGFGSALVSIFLVAVILGLLG